MHASHILGGEIRFKYLGSNGTGKAYVIEVYVNRDVSGQFFLPTIDAHYQGCGMSGSITLNRVSTTNSLNPTSGGDPSFSFSDCTSNPLGTLFKYESAPFIVPNANDCALTFKLNNECCLSPNLGTIANSNTYDIYIRSTLYHTNSHNFPLTTFDRDNSFATCVNTSSIYSMGAELTRTPSDSFYYELKPYTDSINSAIYIQGFSHINPLGASAPNFALNQNTGQISFTGSFIERGLVYVEAQHYKQTPNGNYVLLNTINRLGTIILVANCTQNQANFGYAFTNPAYPTEYKKLSSGQLGNLNIANANNYPSISNWAVPKILYQCIDTTYALPMTYKIDPNSFSADQSQVEIIDSNGNALSQFTIRIASNYSNFGKLYVQGVGLRGKKKEIFFIRFKKGTNGRNLSSLCGLELPDGYTIALEIKDCSPKLIVDLSCPAPNWFNGAFVLRRDLRESPPNTTHEIVMFKSTDYGLNFQPIGDTVFTSSSAYSDVVYLDSALARSFWLTTENLAYKCLVYRYYNGQLFDTTWSETTRTVRMQSGTLPQTNTVWLSWSKPYSNYNLPYRWYFKNTSSSNNYNPTSPHTTLDTFRLFDLTSTSPCVTYAVSSTLSKDGSFFSKNYNRSNLVTICGNELALDELTLPFKLYPNPSNSVLHLEIDEEWQLKLHSISGQLCLNEIGNGNHSFSTEGIAKGVYTLELRWKDEIVFTKWIIE